MAAASAALGQVLRDPVDLGGSRRSAVLRCQASLGGTVVVKSYPHTELGADSFAAEAAGLAFTAGTGAGPARLAVDPVARVIVMADLGAAPSLADLLLGTSADDAKNALLSWARACGKLAGQTAGRQRELAALVAAHQGRGRPAGNGAAAGQFAGRGAASEDGVSRNWLERRIWSLPRLLTELSIGLPPGFADDLADLAAVLRPGRYQVFSPGDICPDNNLVTDAGIRFIDYESADYHCAFLDAAYARMPFGTCWCAFRLPGDLAAQAEEAYRGQVCGAFPDLAIDAVWLPGMRRAMAAWTLHGTAHLLGPSMQADARMTDDGKAAPTARQLLRYRWQRLLGELEPAGELAAISALMDRLLTVAGSWQAPDLPLYPAFRSPGR